VEGTDTAAYFLFVVKFDPTKFGGITKEEMHSVNAWRVIFILQHLKSHGIPTVPLCSPLHTLALFKDVKLFKLKKGIDYSNANWGAEKSSDDHFAVATVRPIITN
jgi:hypothetical protein